ncbi:MAG: FG-GAP-like repeat-containing protein [Pseudomonadota bacterium]
MPKRFGPHWILAAAITVLFFVFIQSVRGEEIRISDQGDPEPGKGGPPPPHRYYKCLDLGFVDEFGCKPSDAPSEWDPDGRCLPGATSCLGAGTLLRPAGGGYAWDRADPLTVPIRPMPISWGFGGGSNGVDLQNGTYGRVVPIDVPPFHGLEPRITVGYSSGAGNGFAGVGWGLTGFSVLTAFSSEVGGELTENGWHRFFLDGIEIFPCSKPHDPTPGCDESYGDSSFIKYFSKVEAFQRIEFRPDSHWGSGYTSGTWKVTEPNGTKISYVQLFKTDQGFGYGSTALVYRWAVQKIEDLHGNQVDFDWAFDMGSTRYGDFYPDRIRYNGNEIRFYRESRPDVSQRATGGVIPSEMGLRLKAIGVSVGGRLRSLHRLRYEMAKTGRSRLQTIDTYGTNAHVTELGDVDNGAAPLPGSTYVYADPTPSLDAGISTTVSGKFCSAPSNNQTFPISNRWDSLNHTLYTDIGSSELDPTLIPVDLNNDGCTDFLVEEYRGGVNEVRAYLSNCDGTFGSAVTTSLGGGHTPISLGDFNGDGIVDLFLVSTFATDTAVTVPVGFPLGRVAPIYVFLGNGDGSFTEFTDPTGTKLPVREIPPRIFNGTNGPDDKYWDAATWTWKPINYQVTTASYARARATKLRVADMNGDGCDDIISFNGCEYIGDADCGLQNMTVYFSRCTDSNGNFLGFDLGSGTTPQGDSAGVPTNIKLFVHGMNRPFKSDGTTIGEYIGHAGYMLADVLRCQLADFNNDGRPDILCIEPSSSGYGYGKLSVYLSEGNTGTQFQFFQNAGPSIFSNDYYGYFVSRTGTGDQYPYSMMVRPFDWNGDGLMDVAIFPVAMAHSAKMQIFVNLGNGRFGGPFEGPNQDFSGWPAAYNLHLPQYGHIPTSDWNGDGIADLGEFDPVNKKFRMYLSSGRPLDWTNFPSSTTLPDVPVQQPTCFFPGDFNGDGRIDIAVAKDSGDFTGPVTIYPMESSLPPDILTGIDNSIGGSETIEYARKTGLIHEDRPYGIKTIPAPMLVVSSVTKSSGSQLIQTTYDYAGGKLDRSDPEGARFVGFASASTTVPPAEGQLQKIVRTVYFDQNPQGSKVWKTESRLEGGPLLSRATHSFVKAKDLPYLTYLFQTDVESYEPVCLMTMNPHICPSSNPVSHKKVRFPEHDAYGNVTLAIDDGDISVAGDEYATSYKYVSNLEKFILSVPSTIRTYSGSAADRENLIGETLSYTDDQTDSDSPPRDFGQITRVDQLKCVDCAVSWGQKIVSGLSSLFKMPGAFSSNPAYATVRMGYDGFGNLLWAEDPLGHRTTTQYEGTYNLFPVTVTNALGQTTETAWNYVCGVPSAVTDANQQTARVAFDSYCRPIQSQGPTGSYSRMEYCDMTPEGCGQPTSQYTAVYAPKPSGPGELVSKIFFDGLGRTYCSEADAETPGQKVRTDIQFDPQGSPYRSSYPISSTCGSATSPSQWVESHVDPLGRVIETILPDDSRATAEYSGLTVTMTDPAGHKRRETFDTLGRVITIEHMVNGAFQTTQSFEYDTAGHLSALTDAMGAKETYVYDLRGLPQVVQSPHIGTRTMTYNGGGRLLTQQDSKGQTISFDYDVLGRTVRKTIQNPDGTPVAYIYSYDQVRPDSFNIGRMTGSSGPNEVNFFDYDLAGRMHVGTRIIDGISYGFQWWYDRDGRVLAQKFSDNDFVGTPDDPLTYDNLGRLKTIPGYVTNAAYDPIDGSLTELHYANGEKISYQYDPDRKWLTQIEASRNGTAFERLQYQSFDATGKLLGMQKLDGSRWTYQYNDLSELTRAQFNDPTHPTRSFEQTFDYNLNGNLRCNSAFSPDSGLCRTSDNQPTGWRNYYYDTLNRPHALRAILAKPGGRLPSMSFDYDENGNMKQRNNGGNAQILWNSESRPVSIGNIQFVYDAQNSRLKKITPLGTTLYLGFGAEIENGTFIKHISFGGIPVAQKKNNTVEWLHTDRTGSVYRVSGDQGQEIWKQDYRPYGEEITPQAAPSPLRFAGQRMDDETGLMFLNARYYDPATGKFISPDPLATTHFPQGTNAYQYAANDPVNKGDASGLYPRGDPRNDLPYQTWHIPLGHSGSDTSPINLGGTTASSGAELPALRNILRGNGFRIDEPVVTSPPKPAPEPEPDIDAHFPNGGPNIAASMAGMWFGSKAGGNIANMYRGMVGNLELDRAMRKLELAAHDVAGALRSAAKPFEVAGSAIVYSLGTAYNAANVPLASMGLGSRRAYKMLTGTPDFGLLDYGGWLGAMVGGLASGVEEVRALRTTAKVVEFAIDRPPGVARVLLTSEIQMNASQTLSEVGQLGGVLNRQTGQIAQLLGTCEEVATHIETVNALGWQGKAVGFVLYRGGDELLLSTGTSYFHGLRGAELQAFENAFSSELRGMGVNVTGIWNPFKK